MSQSKIMAKLEVKHFAVSTRELCNYCWVGHFPKAWSNAEHIQSSAFEWIGHFVLERG